MSPPLPPSVDELGRFHRFGDVGPAYEVLGPAQALEAEADWLMRIVVLETGEKLTYRASDIRDDPDADAPPVAIAREAH